MDQWLSIEKSFGRKKQMNGLPQTLKKKNEIMISCMRYGQLGNQMFQIAAAIGLSLRYNIPYCIPKHTKNDETWKPYNDFENVNYCDSERIGTACVYNEKGFTYSKIPKPHCNYYLLNGYFQSDLYFKDFRKEILKAFGFDFTVTGNRTISIHVRRGDYLNLPNHHPVITMEYISKAIDYFEELGYYNFLVFSDDMKWAKENINHENFQWSDFTYSENKTPINDLIIMSSCDHNIIANSTFSWWGAWLNNNPNKIVVRPAKWFGEEMNHDMSTLCPENWIVL